MRVLPANVVARCCGCTSVSAGQLSLVGHDEQNSTALYPTVWGSGSLGDASNINIHSRFKQVTECLHDCPVLLCLPSCAVQHNRVHVRQALNVPACPERNYPYVVEHFTQLVARTPFLQHPLKDGAAVDAGQLARQVMAVQHFFCGMGRDVQLK